MPLLTCPPAFPADSLTLNPGRHSKRAARTEMDQAFKFLLRGSRKVMYGKISSRSQEKIHLVKKNTPQNPNLTPLQDEQSEKLVPIQKVMLSFSRFVRQRKDGTP